jgi:glycerol transport system ATP-binding protein
MVELFLEGVTHVYGGMTEAVRNVTWKVPDKTSNALLGPSGCGKTTLMKIISGLLKPTEGRVYFDGKDVTDMTPQERDVGMVFQFPAMYPDMNVYQNIAYPLHNIKTPKHEIRKRVIEVAEALGITHLLDKHGPSLSFGDRQLVSLARVLVRPKPSIILLDEPLTQVEPERRTELRKKLREVKREFGQTMIFVTHDQTEALTFAELVAVMKDGRILQYDSKINLYERPTDPFIGYFIGSPGMNILPCSLVGDEIDLSEFRLKIPEGVRALLEKHGTEFKLGIRPEHIELSKIKEKDSILFLCSFAEFQGGSQILTLNKGSINIKVRTREIAYEAGDNIWVRFPAEKILFYGKDDKLIT